MKTKLFTLTLAALTIGLLGSCKKDNGPETPQQNLPEGALSGKFTVNEEGKQVHFSKGNLYYDGNAFNFETNQYDVLFSWNASHIGHFFWSKTASVAYAQDYSDEDVSDNDIFFANATAETAKADFTVNGVTGKYRALSSKEWNYLLNYRTVNGGTGEGKSYSFNITYGGTRGLVLYPDNYTGSVIFGMVATLPEGVVFLPEAGFRLGPKVEFVGDGGDYWASTANTDRSAYTLHFGYYFAFTYMTNRFSGLSVRLVTDAN